MELIRDLYRNKRLILKLSKNDFKTRFAGSYLGIIWAFIQPVVTVVVYWFVFEKGLKVGNTVTKDGLAVPFVLWLTSGLVPWFFFSEALNISIWCRRLCLIYRYCRLLKYYPHYMCMFFLWLLRLFYLPATGISRICTCCRLFIIPSVCLCWCWRYATLPALLWCFSRI